tara:strand:+ start:1051 stop:1434 length:384 start_codon:yes stop_codon:yes gene_type:complete
MLSMQQTNVIGQIINDTWGESSTPKSASSALNVKLSGENTMTFKYTTIVTFATEKSLHDQRKALDLESAEVINKRSADIKKLYKDETGGSLSLTEISSDDSLEIIYFNQYTPLRRAYYRRTTIFNCD